MTKKSTLFIFAAIAALFLVSACNNCAQDAKNSPFPDLDQWAREMVANRTNQIGYPVNQDNALKEFYKWFVANDLEMVAMNNVGNPFGEESPLMSTHKYEVEALEFFRPLFGFDEDNFWGMMSSGGTDGNNHGIYFGVNYLRNATGKMPIMYVSDEAHYSNMRLAHLQNLDMRLIKSDSMGRMIPAELEKALDPTRPCLIVYAMGSTFKGAIDDQKALNEILDKYPQMPVYRHVDAALFGGYLPFTQYRYMVDSKELRYNSIAISGHKFFGMDEPTGLFLTTLDVYEHQSDFNIPYLNQEMNMISCSRSALSPLKMWWLIKTVGYDVWHVQAEAMIENTAYLKAELDKIGWPCWVNEYSNTIFMKRPAKEIIKKYYLACSHDDQFGGDLAHIVVMQHVTKEKIDALVADIKASAE